MRNCNAPFLIAILSVATLALSAGAPGSSVPGEGAPDHRVHVGLEFVTTERTDSIDGPTELRGESGDSLAPGERGIAYLSAGEDGCSQGSGTLALEESGKAKRRLLATTRDLWWAEFTLLAASRQRIAVDVDWEHWSAGKDGRARRMRGDRRRIEMRHGSAHVLDFLEIDPEAQGVCARNVMVRLSALIAEDPAFQHRIFEFDLWLEHRDPSGRSQTRHFRSIGGQGETVTFRLLPLRFPGAAAFPDGSSLDAIVEVMGGITARMLQDGQIEIELGATRWNDAELHGNPRRGGIGGGGQKTFRVRPGETVAMPLPAPGGKTGLTLPTGEQAWVDATFYRGHEDRLILTVTPRV